MASDQENNVTRHNIPQPEDGVESLGHLASGYGNDGGAVSTTLTIPPCGIEDCDRALHGLFDKTIKFSIQEYGGGQEAIYLKKPRVIFATGERFALAKKLRPPRDKNQVLLLPSISIRRKSIEQTDEDISSRGMNQFSGDIVIKTRLSPEDSDYQAIINKMFFQHGPTTPTSLDDDTQVGTLRGETSVLKGALLEPQLGNNIFEVFTIPQPQFFTANYEVVFWTNYQEQMNYMIETMMSAFLPQGKMFKLGTDKGYWFIAYMEDSLTSSDNFDDFSGQERIVRYAFNMRIKGFVLAPNGPANPVPVRRYLSAPRVMFEIKEADTTDILPEGQFAIPPLSDVNQEQFVLSDINQNPQTAKRAGSDQGLVFKKEEINPITGKKTLRYVKTIGKNRKKGETVFYASDVKTMQEFLLTGK